jgi:hypothetical protein
LVILDIISAGDSTIDVDTTLLMLFQMNSMGLRSGEYGGKNIRIDI